MSQRKPNEMELAKLKIECPKCRAYPGDWCFTKADTFATRLHPERTSDESARVAEAMLRAHK